MTGKKRDAPLSYRPPQALREAFQARVSASGLTANAYITRAIFGQAAPRARPVSALDQKLAATLLSQAGRISDQLRAVEPASQGDADAALQACHAELREIRTCLMRVLGREP